MRKTSIRTKLLASIFTVLLALYLAASIAVCVIVQRLLVEQAFRDNSQVLSGARQQMQTILTLTDMTAQQIITDEEFGQIMEEVRTGDPSRTYVNTSHADALFRRYMSLNPFILNISCVSWDGAIYSNRGVFLADFFWERTREDWFLRFMRGDARKTVSGLYRIPADAGGSREVVITAYKFRNLTGGIVRDNYLMIDISVSQFKSILTQDGESAILVTGPSGDVIVPSARMDPSELRGGPPENGRMRLKNFIVLHSPMPETGWQLYYPIANAEFNRPVYLMLAALIALFSLVLLISIWTLSRMITRLVEPVKSITGTVQAAYNGNLDVTATVHSGDELEILSDCFNKLISDLKEHIAKIIQEENIKKQMQMDLLMSQIHPHFIYNTLNSAVYLIEEEESDRAIEVIYSLIAILQDTVKIGNKEIFTTVAQELELLKAYLKIAAARYPGQFDVFTQCDPGLMEEPIPKVLIQPLVENAIFHGILPAKRKGEIRVTIRREDRRMLITVLDDGVGVKPEELDRLLKKPETGLHGVGIANIRNRLRFLYNAAGAEFSISARPEGGTIVRISVPLDGPVQKTEKGG